MAITRAQQAKQLLKEGGRTGFFSAGLAAGDNISPGTSTTGASRSSGGDDRREQASVARTQNRRAPTPQEVRNIVSRGPDRSKVSDFQEYQNKLATGRLGRIDQMGGPLQYKKGKLIDETGRRIDKTFRRGFTGELNPREKIFENFLDTRPKVNLFGLGKLLEKPIQAFSDWNTAGNRRFFQDVIRAGRIPGLNFGTVADMTSEELEQAFQDYMSDRLAGKTDAYGNPLITGDDDPTRGNLGDELPPFPEREYTGPVLPYIPGRDVKEGEKEETTSSSIGPELFRVMADGGMTYDAPMIEGGLTDLALRDEFFLGGVVKGIKKAVKGATKAVKKIAKSPIGKAALLGAGLGFAGIGPFSGLAGTSFGKGLAGFFGKGSFNPFMAKGKFSGLGSILNKAGLVSGTGGLTSGGIITALTAAPFIGDLLGLNKQEEEESIYAGPGVDPNAQQFYRLAADGGLMRVGYADGSNDKPTFREFVKNAFLDSGQRPKDLEDLDIKRITLFSQAYTSKYGEPKAEGGIMDKEPVAKKTMPLLDMDGQEMDFRAEGGFVPIGRMEKADDVPARLSKNEFVFTADAVRNAGDGDVDKGAEVMYNMMKNLESGGDVSEESQGLEGARKMFQTSQRLEEVL